MQTSSSKTTDVMCSPLCCDVLPLHSQPQNVQAKSNVLSCSLLKAMVPCLPVDACMGGMQSADAPPDSVTALTLAISQPTHTCLASSCTVCQPFVLLSLMQTGVDHAF